jgi:Tol biopolymer transport system component
VTRVRPWRAPGRLHGDVAISPDGLRIATHIHEEPLGGNLWLWDVGRGNFSQFTFDRSHNMVPIWAPDGSSILFASNRGSGIFNLYRKAATGATAEELVFESKDVKLPDAWTAQHGGVVLFGSGRGIQDFATWGLSLGGERTPARLTPANASEFLAEFSPDGRWIAYSATEAGLQSLQVYVRSYPGLNGPWRVSPSGGNHPRWSADGRELYYLTLQGTAIMAAAISTDGASLSVAAPRALVKTRARFDHFPGGLAYDVARDGRFLVNELIAPEPAQGSAPDTSSFTVVLNFTSALAADGSQ